LEEVFCLQGLTFNLFLGDECGITPNPTFNEVFGFVKNEGKLECTSLLLKGRTQIRHQFGITGDKGKSENYHFLKIKTTYKSTLELSLKISQNQLSLRIPQIECSYKD